MRASVAPILLLALTMASFALTQATTETHYYLLAVQGTPPARLPAAVRVHPFTIDTAFAGERIAYQTQPTRLDRYTFNRWATFFFSSRRRHTSCLSDWSSDVCSSD